MSDSSPSDPLPDDIGSVRLRLQVPASRREEQGAERYLRAAFIGLMFSPIPVLLTSLVLSKGEARFEPIALAAAVPVVIMAFWLARARDRNYALGSAGFALGEEYFGRTRWESFLYDDIERVEVSLRRVHDGVGNYRFTGYRYAFRGSARRSLVLEGEVQESSPLPQEIHLPPDHELPEDHELRAIRGARVGWSQATGRKPTVEVS